MVRIGAPSVSVRFQEIPKASNAAPVPVAASQPGPTAPVEVVVDEPTPKRLKPNAPPVTYSKKSTEKSSNANTFRVIMSFPPRAGESSSAVPKARTAPAPSTRARKEARSTSTPTRRGKGNLVQALAASTKKGKARAPPPPQAPTAPVPSADLPHFDEAFDETPSVNLPTVSRETFRENEKLRAQREARNFVYEGDAEAPRLTRSGRVVATSKHEEAVDEYGGVAEEDDEESTEVEEPVEDQGLGASAESSTTLQVEDVGDSTPVDARSKGKQKEDDDLVTPRLPPGARAHMVSILETLTGRVSPHPRPFADEETNEALQGLVNLLKGTVERGEGNSALLVGPRGAGKSRTIARALDLMPTANKNAEPIVVRLSGHAQTNDRLAIREMGRQIAAAEGSKVPTEEGDDDEGPAGDEEEYAPTTLPSHLLALLTAPSPRAIVIIIEEFDEFTEHARQALLYCLLDVVQSIKTGPVEATGRGVAVIGVTSRVDTLLLLEKRVKSRFSHRIYRVVSPLSPDSVGWGPLLRDVLVPWESADQPATTGMSKEDRLLWEWKGDWQFAIETLLGHPKLVEQLDRLSGLTTDVRLLYRPFVAPMTSVLVGKIDFLPMRLVHDSVVGQIDAAGWGSTLSKLKGLPQPCLAILIISKHLAFAGREEFNLVQVEEEYLRFSRTKLVGSGKTRWPVDVIRISFEHLQRVGLLLPAANLSGRSGFHKFRCALTPHEIVGWFRQEGGAGLGPELATWGKTMGGHA